MNIIMMTTECCLLLHLAWGKCERKKKTSMDWIARIGDIFFVSTVNQPNQGTLKEWQIVYYINKKLFSSTKILEMIIRIYNKIHTSTYSTQEQSRTASQAFCIGAYHLGLETKEVKLKEVYAVPLMYLWLTKYTYYNRDLIVYIGFKRQWTKLAMWGSAVQWSLISGCWALSKLNMVSTQPNNTLQIHCVHVCIKFPFLH